MENEQRSMINHILIVGFRTVGLSGFALLAGLCSFGFGTFPSKEGHDAYMIGVILVLLSWIYERFGHLLGVHKKHHLNISDGH